MFGLCIPGADLADLTDTVGRSSGRTLDKFKHHAIGARAGSVLDVPLIKTGCSARMECRLISERPAEDADDTCFAEVLAATADSRVFVNGRWSFGADNTELQTIHHLGGGQFVHAAATLGAEPL